jgi:galactose mutarotase-like enzyme
LRILPSSRQGSGTVHDRQGFRSYGLRNGYLSIEVVPDLGAKIISLRNLATGREWMWSPSAEPKLFRNQPNDAFEASTLIGADECLPTIAPCRFHGRDLADHGEAWSAPWTVEETALPARIETSIRLTTPSIELRRSISIQENEISFDYRLTSLSSEPERFLWAFHPLMPIEDGACIELPGSITSVKLGAVKGIAGPAGSCWNWPEPTPGLRLDRMDCRSHANNYAKMFAQFASGADAFAAIRRERERLVFRFDPAEIPVAGIWFTYGGWNGHSHLAIEPTNAATDSLCDVVPTRHSMIEPFQNVAWRFRITIETL